MVSASVCLLLALYAAEPGPSSDPTIYRPNPRYAQAAAGQTYTPPLDTPLSAQPGNGELLTAPLAPGSGIAAPAGPGVYYTDPFLGGAPAYAPQSSFGTYSDPGLSTGAVGPQPYRFGGTTRLDFGFLPAASTSNGLGDFEILETNAAVRYTWGVPDKYPEAIFAVTPEFNFRSWEGPQYVALPGQVYRFATDFELSTPANNPVSFQLGFTPSLGSDLDTSVSGDAWMFDGRAVAFFRANPELTVAVGAAYLDRVQDQIIPYAGVIWTPNDRFEARLMFPKARVSYLVGGFNDMATWVYGSLEYNVEAYQIGLRGPDGRNEQIQIQDYRALLGLRVDDGNVAGFIEAGYVFKRDVDFLHGTPDFGISSGFVTRLGLRY